MQIPVRKVRTLMQLAPADRTCALVTLLLMAAMRLALWTLPFRWVKRTIEVCKPVRQARDRFTERRIAWAVRLASRTIPRATCLTQAVTAQVLLNWAGIEASLYIGVRRDEKFAAHAWVNCGGRILVGESEDAGRFTPILTLGRN